MMKQSVRQFYIDIANKTAKVTPLTGDCRSTIAKALQHGESGHSEIVIVGLAPDHAIHAFTTNSEGQRNADVYKNAQYDPKTGIYTRIRDEKPEELDTLYRMPVHEFMNQWVDPRIRPGEGARIDAHVSPETRTLRGN